MIFHRMEVKMKAIIGITPSHKNGMKEYNIKKNYVEAVVAAGGTPLILPVVEDEKIISSYLELIDGLLLSGGIDPDPKYWEEESEPGMGKIDPLRDEFELFLLTEAIRMDLPLLGICRGLQMLNIAFGGTIIQDLSTEKGRYLKHMQDAPHWYPTHKIEIKGESLLKKVLGTDIYSVNSFHHQACGELGDGLKVTAKTSDGIVEAVEGTDKEFVLGVQWHPETMYNKDRTTLNIFKNFVSVSKSNKNRRDINEGHSGKRL